MRPRPVPLLSLLFILLIGCGGGGVSNNSNTSTTQQGSFSSTFTPDHVFLIVLENHGFSQVIGSPAMPYLNSLAAQHISAVNYFADTHPSIGNYFMLTVGAIETNDDDFAGSIADNNIVRALSVAGKTWKAYMESIPSAGYLGGDVYPYAKHHNPFAYLSDVVGSTAQAANIVPFTQAASDLNSAALPNFAFIVPNLLHDAHDCPGGPTATCPDTDKLAAADNWLQANIDPLIHNPSLANSVFIITFDESQITDTINGGGQVALVMAGSHVKTAFQSSIMHQHQSTLHTVLDLLKVSNAPNTAASATVMTEFFQ
jgi:hypothetical protein